MCSKVAYVCNTSEEKYPEHFSLNNKFKYLGLRRHILFNVNIHTEQENQQHNVAHEWRQVALQEASNPHEDRRFSSLLFFLSV
jgi:hypothetical protein